MTVQLELLKRSWCEECEPIVASSMKGRDFTTDDLHPILPKPDHVNWFGVLLAIMKRKGKAARITYRASARPEANGRVVGVWRLT